MKVLLLGATGATGQHVARQAIEAGVELDCYVRNPSRLQIRHPRLRIIEGTLDDAARLVASLAGCDAVISTLGHRNLFDARPFISQALELVLGGMREHGVRRIIYEGAYGTGKSAADSGVLFSRLIRPVLLRHPYADHERSEALLRASDREWVIVRPVALTNGRLTKRIIARERLGLKTLVPSISRADVAAFMVAQLASSEFVGRAVGLAQD